MRSPRQRAPGTDPVRSVLRSRGAPLAPSVQGAMETRLGHDFSRIRVHADARAADSAEAVGARAYTVGRHVVFGAGQYAPQTDAGQALLAHELVHAVQQREAPAPEGDPLRVSSPSDATEREASQLSSGLPGPVTQTSAPHVARQDKEEAPSCPVASKGTLSRVSWGESSGLYPSSKNLYDPSKWDAAKTCELLKMRAALHEVAKRGQSVHEGEPGEGAVEQKLKPYHLVESFPAVDPEIADSEVKWFYLSPNADAQHTGIKDGVRVKSYGTFHNVGGGDVKKGPVYVHFYKVAKKS